MPHTELTTKQADSIEQLIDSVGLAAVLDAILAICDAKSQHIRENWQDEPLARQWDRAGRRVMLAIDEAKHLPQ